MSIWMFLGGIGGASAVAAGAYGAHGLTKHTSDKYALARSFATDIDRLAHA